MSIWRPKFDVALEAIDDRSSMDWLLSVSDSSWRISSEDVLTRWWQMRESVFCNLGDFGTVGWNWVPLECSFEPRIDPSERPWKQPKYEIKETSPYVRWLKFLERENFPLGNSDTWPQLFKRWIITIQRILQLVSLILIHCTVIYPVDSFI